MLLAFGVVCALLEAQTSRRGPGRRRRHGRRRCGPDDDVPRASAPWASWTRRAGHEPARHRRALLRRVRDAPTASTCRSARSSPSSTPSCCASRACRTIQSSPKQMDRSAWPDLKERFARGVPAPRPATSGASSWSTPTCASPRCCRSARRRSTRTTSPAGTFVERDGVVQPAPAPRFSRTQAEIQRPPSYAGQHTDEVLADWGIDAATHRQAARDRREVVDTAASACRCRPSCASTPIPTTRRITTGGTMAKAAAGPRVGAGDRHRG